MKRLFLLLSTLMLAGVCEAAPVRIAGQVTNGSRNKAPAAGATIKLVRMDEQNGGAAVLRTAKADARGAFDMGRVDVPQDDLLFARVEWQGYPYISPAYDGGKQLQGFDIKPEKLELAVFDTTEDDPPMAFSVHHVAVKTEGANLKCIERIVVENGSNKTYIGTGKNGITILLPLPKGAKDVKIDPRLVDAKLHNFNGVYGVSKPIMPQEAGQRNAVIVEYTMPWTKEGVNLSRKLQYPTLFFFVAREESDKELQVNAPQLGKDETQELPIDGGMQKRIVNPIGSPQGPEPALQAGTDVKIVVTRPTNPLVWAFVAFVGALCAIVPLTLLRKRAAPRKPIVVTNGDIGVNTGKSHPVGAEVTHNGGARKIAEPATGASVNGRIHTALAVSPDLIAMPPAARELIDRLAQLDEDWEAGKIERDVYDERRAAWKTKLIELLSTSDNSRN
jgi:hypothetical protein